MLDKKFDRYPHSNGCYTSRIGSAYSNALLCALLLFSCALPKQNGYSPPPPPPGPDDFTEVLPERDGDKELFTVKQRHSFYPFKQSAEIRIVSFGPGMVNNGLFPEEEYRLPVANDTICFSKLAQVKVLTAAQTDTLTDILYNECPRWTQASADAMGCYYPRNAILFLDAKGLVFEYMEICLECHQQETKTEKFTEPGWCNPAYERLELFFDKLGIYHTEDKLPVRD